MVVANLIALVQSNIKRMLAYSSIAHGGYLIVGVVAANEMASGAMLFYLLVYTLMNIGAFAIVISVAHQGEDRLQRHLVPVAVRARLLGVAGGAGAGLCPSSGSHSP